MPLLDSLAATRLRGLTYQAGSTPIVYRDLPGPNETGFSVNQLNARTTDLLRLGRLLATSAGIAYGANQALLAQGDLTALANGAPIGSVKDRLVSTLRSTVGSTAPLLAQAPVNGTGVHVINAPGPSYLVPENNSPGTPFGDLVRDVAGPEANNIVGAPIALEGGTIPDRNIPSALYNEQGAVNPRTGEVLPWPGGTPAGFNTINSPFPDSENSTIGFNLIPEFERAINLEPTTTGVTGEEVTEQSIFVDQGVVSRDIKTPRLYIDDKTNQPLFGELSTTPTLDAPNIGDRETSYTTTTARSNLFARIGTSRETGQADSINAMEPVTNYMEGLGDDSQIIPFIFQPYSVNHQQTLYFRAYLDSFNDNFSGNWNETQYIGRGDKYYTYGGFDRDIDFSFKVAASSKEELQPLYRKLNYLAGATAPTYQDGLFMRGTLVQLTIGDYLKGTHGYIGSVGLSWQTSYPWEIGRNADGGRDLGTIRVPHLLDVSIAFKPIHDFPARFNTGNRKYFGFGEPYGGSTT